MQGPAMPGGLLGDLFSFLLGTRLPGRDTIYLKPRTEFPAQANQDLEFVATVEIIPIRAQE